MNEAFGRYRLLERLGQGGMAEVFKAKSFGVEGFEKVLVIKRILPELAKSPEFVEMFIHEAKLAVRLSHANIVQVFDLGIAPAARRRSGTKRACRLLHGDGVRERVRPRDAPRSRSRRSRSRSRSTCASTSRPRSRRGSTTRTDAATSRCGRSASSTATCRPQNVLLSLEGEVKVTDFGIAKARGALDARAPEDTQHEQLHGKFAYMSPEQARGDAVDARSDLFSLGHRPLRVHRGGEPVQRADDLRDAAARAGVRVSAHRDPAQRHARQSSSPS